MNLTQGLKRSLQQTPDKVAVRYQGRQSTFSEFGDRVARLAGALKALGMRDGDLVAMLSLNSSRYLEYYMAVPWAGGVLNPCNIRWSVAEIVYSLDDSKSTILIVDDAFTSMADDIRRLAKTVSVVIYAGYRETPSGMVSYEDILKAAEPVPDACLQGSNVAGIFYTGGTTGFPKGVMLTHQNLWSSAISILAEGLFPQDSVCLHAAPMFHLADLSTILAQFIRGGTHVVVPGFTPEAVVQSISQDRVTDTLLVPIMIQRLTDHLAANPGVDSSSLCRILYGASPIPEAVLDRAMETLPGIQFLQAYGMTELSPLATINPPSSYTEEGRRQGKWRSAGRAGLCTEIRIVDADGKEVSRGTVGEVVVRGPNVMHGYLNNPEQTAAAIKDGWMHTGDGGYMDDEGYIFIVDRIKDMIISGGENVYSAEVENAITQHEAVAMCAAIGIPSVQWGESVHAIVVLKPGTEVTADALISHCRKLIAGYKCPRSVEFRADLPVSAAGKILKSELRKPFWEGRQKQVN
ncbi:MAG: long-chain-fatty-acid--CoA ligase [bacterium]|nr:long-chain-fatty-acid--CoA ligase [bacterium]